MLTFVLLLLLHGVWVAPLAVGAAGPQASRHGAVPLSGAWFFDRPSDGEWDSALSQFRALGGSLVLGFGTAPVRAANASAVRSDKRFAACEVGGAHCVDRAVGAVAKRGAALGEILTLDAVTQYSPAVMTPCAAAGMGEVHLAPLDNATRVDEFWVAVLPRRRSRPTPGSRNGRGGSGGAAAGSGGGRGGGGGGGASSSSGGGSAGGDDGDTGTSSSNGTRASAGPGASGDTGDDPCALGPGDVADVVLIVLPSAMYTPSPADRLRRRVSAAARNGVAVLVGMVALPARQGAPWAVDTPAVPAFLSLAAREARDLGVRFTGAERKAVRGVYQSHEMVLANTTSWIAEYGHYDATARAVHAVDPALQVVVSPYWIVNRDDPSAQSPEDTAAGVAALAGTDLDAVAPQEGRGTGKCGCFTASERDARIADVDANLARYANVNATATFAQQFSASTTDLYAASRRAVDAANARRRDGRRVELWMNLEAFEETHVNPCDAGSRDDRTNASRVVRSWEIVANATSVDRLISFMWDPFFTCVPRGYDGSLAEALAGWRSPARGAG